MVLFCGCMTATHYICFLHGEIYKRMTLFHVSHTITIFFVTAIQDTSYRIVMPQMAKCIHYDLVREKGQIKLTNIAQELGIFWEVCTSFKTN
jgi:hypothetical protein